MAVSMDKGNQVAECFVHLMPYIGVPKTLAAMRCVQAAFSD